MPIREFRFLPRSPIVEPVKEESQEDAEVLKQQEVDESQGIIESTQEDTPPTDPESGGSKEYQQMKAVNQIKLRI